MVSVIVAILTALGCYIWHRLIMLEACALLERCRDNLLLKESQRVKVGEITAFIKRAK